MTSPLPPLNINACFCGRDQEISQLFQQFELVFNADARITMIYGEAGIGKSLLVEKLGELIEIRPNTLFSYGKFDQLQLNEPYHGLSQAFNNIIKAIINLKNSDIKQSFINALKSQLDSNLSLISNFMPSLAELIGFDPTEQNISISLENESRFFLALDQFFNIFNAHQFELVLLLDDVHWIDKATLNVLNYLLLNRLSTLKNIYFIMTSRTEFIYKNHDLVQFIDIYQNYQSENYSEIKLKPLDCYHIQNFLELLFTKTRQSINELAQICVQKTGGNPFFINQFISNLYYNHLIYFDKQSQLWHFKLEAISNQQVTENIVDLILRNISFLPNNTKNLLLNASCLGSQFDLNILAEITHQNISSLVQNLIPALQYHFIIEHDQTYYKFSHDKIQQSFYDLLSKKDLEELHFKIGKHLLDVIPKNQRYERCFEIVDHLNLCPNLIQNAKLKSLVAELNLVASRKAKNKTAYNSALNYIQHSVDFVKLDPLFWKNNRFFAYQVFKEYAQIEYCNGNFDLSEHLIQECLQHADNIIEIASLYDILISQYTVVGRYPEAIYAGLSVMKHFDIEIQLDNLENQFLELFHEVHELLKNKSIKSLLNIPKNDTIELNALATVVKKLGITSYIAKTNLYRVITLVFLKRCLSMGYTPESAINYASYGILLSIIIEDYKKSYKYGNLALKLCDKFKGELRYITLFLHATHLVQWGEHLNKSLDLYREIYNDSIRLGDTQFACYSLLHEILIPFYCGENLKQIDDKFHSTYLFITKHKNYWALALILGFKMIIDNLRGSSQSIDNFDCLEYKMTENSYFQNFNASDTNTVPFAYLLIKSQTFFIYNKNQESLDILREHKHLLPIVEGLWIYMEYHFYLALNNLETLIQADLNQIFYKNFDETIEEVKEILKKFNKWQKVERSNFESRYFLLKAEFAQFQHKYTEAMKFYDQAILSAESTGYQQIYAISCERAGRFWLQQQKLDFAEIYLNKALKAYENWGATRKVDLLSNELKLLGFI